MWYLLCLIPLLIFIPGMNDFIFLPGNNYSDITISHYPNLFFLQQSLSSGHGIPLWSPNILSGYPFIANPLSGIHYPPGWLALLFPLPLGINLVAALHLVWGAYGMYRWLKAEGIQSSVAGLSALAFGLLPKLIWHFAAGHLMLTYAISWTPWLLLADKRFHDSPKIWSNLWRSPGVVLGLVTLADPRWAFYGGLIWFVYLIKLRLSSLKTFQGIILVALHVISQVILAVAVAAALLLPFVQYVSLSTRTLMTPQEVLEHSLPFSGLVNLFFPTTGGDLEWIAYPGAISLALFVAGLANRSLRKRSLIWMILAAATLLLSFGSNLPGMELLAGIPGFSLMRVPTRFLFLTGICLVIAGGFILDALISLDPKTHHIQLLPLVGFTVAVLIFSVGACLLTGQVVAEFFLGAVGVLLAVILIQVYAAGRMSARTFYWSLLVVLLINLVGVDLRFMQSKSPQEVLDIGAGAAAYLSKQPGLFRVYSPSYSLQQQTAIKYRLQLADGVDPLQLRDYESYMVNATGIPSTGYSVILPDFINLDPERNYTTYFPDAEALGFLNIRYVVAEFDLAAEGLTRINEIGEYRIYENRYSQPRAWVQLADGSKVEAQILEYLPNEITLRAEGPGRLYLSEIAYPGWQVQVDEDIPSAVGLGELIRSIELGAGSHVVKFYFRPLIAYAGAGISMLTILIIIGQIILTKHRNL